MKKILVAIDDDTSDECLYVDGVCWKSVGETTVYASDIAEVAGTEPIVFEHREVPMLEKLGKDWSWPKLAGDLP